MKSITKNVLYISYDGLTDPLGQSQVLPYLEGLSKEGYNIFVISAEKKESYNKNRAIIQAICDRSNISWNPIFYTKRPPVFSTIYDVFRIYQLAKKSHSIYSFSIVHCRSYVSALIGRMMQNKFNIKFVFDMRGFWADERIDGHIWSLKNPLHRLIFLYFKKKEKEFLQSADYTITLTQKAKEIIKSWPIFKNKIPQIEVIPCCADLSHFSLSNVNTELAIKLRSEYQIGANTKVLTYLGSIGTWYMLDEMLDFFVVLLKEIPTAKFLFLTFDNPADIIKRGVEKGISKSSLLVTPVNRKDIPTYLSLSDWSIFFIKPVFSKQASSPTKQGEIMSMGIPIFCNDNIGDTTKIVTDFDAGVVVKDFTSKAYQSAINKMLTTDFDVKKIKEGSKEYYDLQKGVTNYLKVYTLLAPL